jgi:hypothetical protein
MSTTPTTIVEGFSISHAAILDGTSGGYPFGGPSDATDGDIYGVRDGSLEPDLDSYDNTGDDTVLSRWFWFNFVNVSVSGGYVPLKMVALLTGETIQSSSTGANTVYSLPLWTQASLNVAPKPMLIRVPSKDSTGKIRTIDIVLYKVQFQPITFDGPTYKDGLVINYAGTALSSSLDEKGQTLPNGQVSIGRFMSKP